MKLIIEDKESSKTFHDIPILRRFSVFLAIVLFNFEIFEDKFLEYFSKFDKKSFFNRCFYLFFDNKINMKNLIDELLGFQGRGNFELYEIQLKK